MKSPKTIYVVTSGEYSSYGIAAVFDDEQMAEEYRRRFGCDYVEEYELNPFIPMRRKGFEAYFVRMTRGGNVQEVCQSDTQPNEGYQVHGQLRVTVLAKDEHHAVKIVNEKRAQMIALGQWPEDKP